jgi:aryl-alcohol dehydrogenase-like predicted oxidoreductase
MVMEARQCGDSDLKLPTLGIGCWSFGGGDYWGPQQQSDVEAVVQRAVECGCNFFDTAEAYNNGESEISLGRALKGISRDKVILATKISPSNTAAEALVRHCEASLRRLQIDYIDLYMVHWPITAHSIRHFTPENIEVPRVQNAFDTLMRLQQTGKIRHIGVSNFGRVKLDEAIATGAKIVINELPYSLLSRAIESEILPYCRGKGVGVVAYMPLMQGVLADHYASFDVLPASRRRTRHFDSRSNPACRHGLDGVEKETQATLESIRRIARQHHLRTPEMALKWVLAREGITSTLCGSRNIRTLEANVQAASKRLARDIVKELNVATVLLRKKLGPSFDYYENPSNDRTQ